VLVTLSRTFRFDAAHRNTSPFTPAMTARTHGHTWELALRATGTVDEQMGWLLDFGRIKEIGQPLVDRLDHRCLNDIEGLSHTSTEDIAHWAQRQLVEMPKVAFTCDVRIVGATSYEPIITDSAVGNGDRLAFGFAGAHFLPRLPKSHKCRRLHGHSFQLAIGTNDSEGAIAPLRALYPTLDHTLLNDIEGLENPTSENLARWLWRRLGEDTALQEIEVSETCTTSCVLRGE
jgi:6-pyruvoyltetrahydropterin/6-carboxytetrahydropterin synthase